MAEVIRENVLVRSVIPWVISIHLIFLVTIPYKKEIPLTSIRYCVHRAPLWLRFSAQPLNGNRSTNFSNAHFCLNVTRTGIFCVQNPNQLELVCSNWNHEYLINIFFSIDSRSGIHSELFSPVRFDEVDVDKTAYAIEFIGRNERFVTMCSEWYQISGDRL